MVMIIFILQINFILTLYFYLFYKKVFILNQSFEVITFYTESDFVSNITILCKRLSNFRCSMQVKFQVSQKLFENAVAK